jgi:hypothetical protein
LSTLFSDEVELLHAVRTSEVVNGGEAVVTDARASAAATVLRQLQDRRKLDMLDLLCISNFDFVRKKGISRAHQKGAQQAGELPGWWGSSGFSNLYSSGRGDGLVTADGRRGDALQDGTVGLVICDRLDLCFKTSRRQIFRERALEVLLSYHNSAQCIVTF